MHLESMFSLNAIMDAQDNKIINQKGRHMVYIVTGFVTRKNEHINSCEDGNKSSGSLYTVN
jgi:hypothetical protein